MKDYIVKIYDKEQDIVECFIKENGTVFHSYDFLVSVGRNYKCIVVFYKSEIVGVFPLVYSSRYKRYSLNLPPFTHVNGPVFAVGNVFIKEVLDIMFSEVSKEKRIDLKCFGADISNALNTAGFDVSNRDVQIVKYSDESLMNLLHKDKRRGVNKFERLVESEKVKFIEGEKALDYILKIYDKTSKRAGFQSNIKEMEVLMRSGVEKYFNVLLSDKGIILSGSFCLLDKKKMYLVIVTSDRDVKKEFSNSNAYSVYIALQKSRELKLDFDFMGSMIPGVAKFNNSMGGETQQVYTCIKTNSFYYKAIDFIKGMQSV